MFHRNVGTLLQVHTVSQPRRPPVTFLLPQEPQVLHYAKDISLFPSYWYLHNYSIDLDEIWYVEIYTKSCHVKLILIHISPI
jgi:hypothetical protein